LEGARARVRSATSRGGRAKEARREGDAIAGRVSPELERAAAELADLASSLRSADEALAAHSRHEEDVRNNLSAARSSLEQGERLLRELREQLHRADLDRQSAEREREE